MSLQPLRIGLVGLGTVGGGVAKILLGDRQRMSARAGREVQLQRVAVRDLHKPRAVRLPAGILTEDPLAVAADPEIDVVVELIGGLSPAREIVEHAIRSGKDVVTANKALLCEHGPELFALAREQHRCIAFEAAVAGGIPIVHVLAQAMSANQITSLEAILNGTSNFILTEMLGRSQSYEDALREAQQNGYAEADPTMDVDGTDAGQKLCLLTQLAFGTRVTPEEFLRQGIDMLDLTDLKYADELGYTVKLLATAKLVERSALSDEGHASPTGSRHTTSQHPTLNASTPDASAPGASASSPQLEVHVQPTLIRHNRPLAQVDGAYNMVAITGDHVGPTWYSGPGAGAMPTASAVVSDLIDVAAGRAQLTFALLSRNWGLATGGPSAARSALSVATDNGPRTTDATLSSLTSPRFPVPGPQLQPAEEITRRYYLRLDVEDKPHVIADITDVLGRHGISLASVIQHEAPEPDEFPGERVPIVPLVIMTHRTREGALRAAGRELDDLDCLRPPWVCMPVSD